jgi:hypothetical protein
MSESLGLSIGVANLVAARAGSDPVTRRSVLTLFDEQPSEVGLPEQNPNTAESGLVMRGFVERVGDGTPLVASDGTKYLGDALTVEALEVMARSVGYGTPITIAVPAYWSEGQSTALREEFFAQPGLTAHGVAPALVSDATAALTALRAEPGFPTSGVVALCDFGAAGTTVTLFRSAGAQIGPSVRYTDFSGDAIDQLVLNHLRGNSPSADTTGGLASTTRMGSLTRQLKQCRLAKEQLSAASVATVDLGSGEEVQLSRNEFDELISEPLDRFVDTVEELLQRNEIRATDLTAVATVGGGAHIPLLGARLSERLQVPIHSTPAPAFSAAIGAAVLGDLQPPAPTTAAPVIENPTELAPAAAPDMTQVLPGARIEEDGPLAWSEDPDADSGPVPYTGPEHSGQYVRDAMDFDDSEYDGYGAESGRLPWYKRTVLLLAVGSAALALLLLGVVLALTLGHNETPPVTPPSQTTPAPPPPPTPQTVTVTESTTTTTTTTEAPPPPTYTTEAPVTTTAPPTTTEPPVTTTTLPTTTELPPPTRDRPHLFPLFPRWR